MSSSSVAAPAYKPWEDTGESFARPWTPRVLKGGLDRRPPGLAATPITGSPVDSAQFEVLADELLEAATTTSNMRRLRRHRAYVGILSMGKDATPLILSKLSERGERPVWLALLSSLTRLRPTAAQSVDEAAADWLSWGKLEGLI